MKAGLSSLGWQNPNLLSQRWRGSSSSTKHHFKETRISLIGSWPHSRRIQLLNAPSTPYSTHKGATQPTLLQANIVWSWQPSRTWIQRTLHIASDCTSGRTHLSRPKTFTYRRAHQRIHWSCETWSRYARDILSLWLSYSSSSNHRLLDQKCLVRNYKTRHPGYWENSDVATQTRWRHMPL